MIKIKQLKKNNEDFYPVVPIESVVFPDGSTLNDKDLVVEGDLQNFYNKSEADSKFVTNPEHDADVTRLEGAIEELSDKIDNIRPGGIESETDPVFSASPAANITNSDIQNWNSKSSTSGTVTGVKVNGVNATVTNGIAEVNIPVNNVDESTIAGYGFTKNQGTITGITMNGLSKGVSGNIDLGTVITEHQNISGKENTSNKVTSISSSSTNNQYPSAKAVYDKIGDLSQLSTSAKGNLVSAINEAANSSSFSGNYNDLTGKPTIPTQLSQLSEDATHQTVTVAEKESWNASSGFSGDYEELRNKPTIPTEQTVAGWGFAKTANITESDPTVPSYVKNISQNDIANWNSKTSNVGTLTGVTFNGSPAQVVNGVAQVVAATGTGGDENIIESISVNNVQQAVSNKNVNIIVPTTLADLPTDSTHQTVTSTEKSTWNAKSSFSGNYNDLQGKPSTVNYTAQSLTNEEKAQARQNIGAGTSNFGGTYNELTGTPTIPTSLSDLSEDSTHRLVTDSEKSTWNAKYSKPSGGIPAEDLASNVLSGYASQASVDTINSKIPVEASSSNQLADKAFVNSSIASSTGNLITNNGDSWVSLSALQGYSGTVNNNDYAFVSTTDGLGNVVYSRYKYSNGSWVKEYDLNNSSFTQAQWDTINSGATSAKVSAHDSHIANTDIHVTAADKTAWNAKSNFSGSYNDLTNKPSLSAVATSGSYNDLSNKPTIPAAQIQSDWNQTNSSSADFIKNKPTIPNVSGFASSVSVNGNTYNASSGTVTLPNYPTSLPASDVQAWAKSATKPTYTANEVGALPINTHIPDDPVQSDWTEKSPSSFAFIKNKPNLTTYFEPGTGERSLVRKNQNNVASGVGSLALGVNTTASGLYSFAEGKDTISAGFASHAEGLNTYADSYSHAEGEDTKALVYNSHAEGMGSVANGYTSHAEGSSISCGDFSHSEGGSGYDKLCIIDGQISKTVNGNYSTLEFNSNSPISNDVNAVIINDTPYEIIDIIYIGTSTLQIIIYGNPDVTYCDKLIFSYSTAFGLASHAEGWSLAKGNNSHSEGLITFANGTGSHAEGSQTVAEGNISHAEGIRSFAGGHASHAEGSSATIGGLSHSEGGSEYGYFANVTSLSVSTVNNGRCTITYTLDPNSSIPNDAKAVAINDQLFLIIGNTNNALIIETNYRPDITGCHTLYFYNSVAKGNYSHSEGTSLAYGNMSHAEGNNTVAGGLYSHAEGDNTYANSQYSHAEGSYTSTTGLGSHAEGINTMTYSTSAHAEGNYTQATGISSHAEGSNTRATGDSSHAEGGYTETTNFAEHAQGVYNVSHYSTESNYSFGAGNVTMHSIGIGTSNSDRKNAVEVMDNGDVYVKGIGSYDGTNPSQASTLQSVINNASSSGTDPNAMHLTGAETAAGVKTFSDGIVVSDPSYISFGNVSTVSNGFTFDTFEEYGIGSGSSISFGELDSEPKAFILYRAISSNSSMGSNTAGLLSLVGDSTTITGVYTTGTQHNYSTAFTTSYSNDVFTITSSISNIFPSGRYVFSAYYGDGTLTFRQAVIQPSNGQTTATFSNLAGIPTIFAVQLESQVDSASYHRVGSIVGDFSNNAIHDGRILTFYSNNVYPYNVGSNNVTIQYNNGLVINSGGQNNGGYFHNPGTYKLYYLVAEDVAAGSESSNSTLQDELDSKYEKPTTGIPASDLSSDVRTALNNANNAVQTETDPVFTASPAYSITSQHITSWNGKQDALVSGTTLKTINNQSLLGSGNISITGGTGGTGADGADGQSTYKSTVFVRTNNTPNAPTTGSYNSPAPGDLAGTNAAGQSVYWSDGIPAGKETLWASTRKFTNDGVGQDASWSTPRAMTDTETYNVEFAPLLPNDVKPSAPTYGTNGTINNRGTGNNRNDGLYNSFTTARNNNIVWFDPDLDANITGIDFTQMAWRAEQPVINGVGGNWTILRIKGEDGARGDDGDPAIYLDLTNEHDSFLYDTNGNRLTPAISTTAILYEAGEPLTNVTYGIDSVSGCTLSDITLSSNSGSNPGVVTVSGASDSGYVTITATYNGITYSTKFTFTRVVGYAKFDLEITPNAITYNTTTQQASQSTINVEIYCTQQGSSGITRTKLTSLSSRYTLKIDGNSIANNLYGSSGYTFNVDPTRSSHIITLVEGNILWDTETVTIGKVADGSGGSGSGSQGQPGTDGYSSIIVQLYKDYQRGSNDPELPAVTWPSGSNTTTYTFATDTLSAAPTGWSRTRPSSPLGIVYVIAATFSGNTATDTANINEWSDPVPDGALYCDTVELFCRPNTAGAIPSKPTTTVTYNFNTGAISPSSANGWTRTKPVHNGYPLWVTQATVISSAASVSIAGSKWSNPQKLVEDGEDGQSALTISSPQWEFIYPATNEGNLTNPIAPVNNQFSLFYGTTEKAVDKWYLSTRVAYLEDYIEDPNNPQGVLRKDIPIYYIGTDLTFVNTYANDQSMGDISGFYYLWIDRKGTKYYSDTQYLMGEREVIENGESITIMDGVMDIDAGIWNISISASDLPINGLSISNTGLMYSAQNFGFTADVVNVPIFAETTIDGEKVVASEMIHFVKQKAGAQGERGFAGKIMRGISAYTNQPEVPYQGLNDTDPTKIYYDVVTHNGVLYYCKVSEYNNSAAASYEPNVSSGWQNVWEVATNYKFVATDLLLAQNAYIDFLGSRGIYLRDDMGQVVGGAQGGNSVIFWAGGGTNPSTAKFQAHKDGYVEMQNAHVRGAIEATNISLADGAGNTALSINGENFNVVSPTGSFYINNCGFSGTTPYNLGISDDQTQKIQIAGPININQSTTSITIPTINGMFTSSLNNSVCTFSAGIVLERTRNNSTAYFDLKNSSANITSYWNTSDLITHLNTETIYQDNISNITSGAFSDILSGDTYHLYLVVYAGIDTSNTETLNVSFTPNSSYGTINYNTSNGQTINIGSNGFQVYLGDGWVFRAVNNNGTKEMYISCNTGSKTCYLKFDSSGIKINNNDNQGERLL